MPSVLTHKVCHACGHEHRFALLQGILMSGREYEYGYFCPRSGAMASLIADSAGVAVEHPSQGTVMLIAGIDAAPHRRAA